jgi:hypothetical protein
MADLWSDEEMARMRPYSRELRKYMGNWVSIRSPHTLARPALKILNSVLDIYGTKKFKTTDV